MTAFATLRTTPATAAMEAIRSAENVANQAGVEFHADYDVGRITFSINRGAASPGSGALVIETLLRAADEVDVPVMIDVKESAPRLVEYYWTFGFRLMDADAIGERAELEKMRRERQAFMDRNGGSADNYGVTSMWRDRYAGPLV